MPDATNQRKPSEVVLEARRNGDVDLLIECLAKTDQHVRLSAIRSLGMIGGPLAVDALVQQLRSGDWLLRSGTFNALGAIRDPRAARALYEAALEEDTVALRLSATLALGSVGDRRAVPLLLAFIADRDLERKLAEDPWMRRASASKTRRVAAEKLVEMEAVEAVPALQTARRETRRPGDVLAVTWAIVRLRSARAARLTAWTSRRLERSRPALVVISLIVLTVAALSLPPPWNIVGPVTTVSTLGLYGLWRGVIADQEPTSNEHRFGATGNDRTPGR